MQMMKIVIEISEDFYDVLTNEKWDSIRNIPLEHMDLVQKIKNGTPLPHGKWLDKKMTIKGSHGLAYGRYGCSVCKKKQLSKSNFCPNCGADMREVKADDE